MEGKHFSGKRLQKIRIREKMTILALANALGVEPYVIKDYERGRFVPGPNVINRMTVILRCEEADLFE